MRILGPQVLAGPTVINTHPALLPSFPGAHGVRDALAHGVAVTGTTCHVVDAGVDTGPIITQRAVAVEDDDTEGLLVALLEDAAAPERSATPESVTRDSYAISA